MFSSNYNNKDISQTGSRSETSDQESLGILNHVLDSGMLGYKPEKTRHLIEINRSERIMNASDSSNQQEDTFSLLENFTPLSALGDGNMLSLFSSLVEPSKYP